MLMSTEQTIGFLLLNITIYLLKKLVMTHLTGQTMRKKIVATMIATFAIMAQQYQKWKTYLEKL